MVTDKQVRRLFAMKNKVKYLYYLRSTFYTHAVSFCTVFV